MLSTLTNNWWMLTIRGVLAILFGVAAFVWPGLTAAVLVMLFGAYALVDGTVAVIAAIAGKVDSNRWLFALSGVVGIGVGVITFAAPGITLASLYLLIAAWAIIRGVIDLIGAFQVTGEGVSRAWMVAGAVVAMIYGVVMFTAPSIGFLTTLFLIGSFSIAYGITEIGLGSRVRKMGETLRVSMLPEVSEREKVTSGKGPDEL